MTSISRLSLFEVNHILRCHTTRGNWYSTVLLCFEGRFSEGQREKQEWRVTSNCLVSVNSRGSSQQQRRLGRRAGQQHQPWGHTEVKMPLPLRHLLWLYRDVINIQSESLKVVIYYLVVVEARSWNKDACVMHSLSFPPPLTNPTDELVAFSGFWKFLTSFVLLVLAVSCLSVGLLLPDYVHSPLHECGCLCI